jgi:DNA-binding PucR family transcriptional regulator
VIFASLHEYLPIDDLVRIVLVCAGVSVLAPSAAALVITGFELQAGAHAAGRSRRAGDLRIALGVALLAAMIVAGLYTLINR